MNSLSSIALSGMQAAQANLQASAHNVANLQTEGFHRQEIVQNARPDGGVDSESRRAAQEGSALEADVLSQLQARNTFLANLAVFRTAHRLAGVLLDTHA